MYILRTMVLPKLNGLFNLVIFCFNYYCIPIIIQYLVFLILNDIKIRFSLILTLNIII